VVLRVEARDHRVAARDARHVQHPRCLEEVEAARRGEVEQAVVPLPDVVVGPEERVVCLRRSPCRAVDAPELPDLAQVVRVPLTRQRCRWGGPELRRALQRERLDRWHRRISMSSP
jgi:hypothetical protein